jgi:predicted transcriptional regulator
MKRIAHRDKLKIYNDLLSILDDEANQKVVLTHIQLRLNVPFDRLKNYISELTELGLIDDENMLNLTEKGRQYLLEYRDVIEFMKRMGIAYR